MPEKRQLILKRKIVEQPVKIIKEEDSKDESDIKDDNKDEEKEDSESDSDSEVSDSDEEKEEKVAPVLPHVEEQFYDHNLVHTREGLIPVKDVEVGMEVLTMDGYQKITGRTPSKKSKSLTVVTQDGEFQIACDQEIAVLKSVDDYYWKKASELTPGDRLLASRTPIDGKVTRLPAWNYVKPENSTTCKDITVPELDVDMAWFIGLFHGDGYTRPNFKENGFNAYVSIVFGINEYDMAERAKQQLQRFGAGFNITLAKRKGEQSYMVHCQSKQLAWYFAHYFKIPKTSIHIPKFILEATRDLKLAYLCGMLDSDGCVTNRPVRLTSSVYPQWVR